MLEGGDARVGNARVDMVSCILCVRVTYDNGSAMACMSVYLVLPLF